MMPSPSWSLMYLAGTFSGRWNANSWTLGTESDDSRFAGVEFIAKFVPLGQSREKRRSMRHTATVFYVPFDQFWIHVCKDVLFDFLSFLFTLYIFFVFVFEQVFFLLLLSSNFRINYSFVFYVSRTWIESFKTFVLFRGICNWDFIRF